MKRTILFFVVVTTFALFAKESYISSKQILPPDTTYNRVLKSKSLGAIVWDQLDLDQETSVSAQVTETHVGEINNDIGPKLYSAAQPHGLYFDVNESTIIKSVAIYPNTLGTIVIRLLDNTLTVMDSVIYDVITTGIKTPVDLNFFVPVGTNFRLDNVGSVAQLGYNFPAGNFPYTSGKLNIVDTTVGTGYYLFFYDWKLAEVKTYSVGPVDNTIGDGGNYTAYADGIVFDVLSESILNTVNVYPNAIGDITVRLLNSSSVVLDSKTISVSTPGIKTKLDLGFDLIPGTGYKIDAIGTTTGLYRSTSGVQYPYTSDCVELTGAINALNYYYFFYDWEVLDKNEPLLSSYDSELAADFILSEQTTLKRFKTKGWFQNDIPAEHSYMIKFYQDAGNMPAEVAVDSTITTYSYPGYEEIVALDFIKPVTLSAGIYWIGFQALVDSSEYDVGKVYFRTRSVSANSTNAYWRNPLDGYGSGYTTFTNVGYDICFALYSEKGVCGYATGNWDVSSSPYYVDGDIMIPDDSLLTIEPGVEFIFRNIYDIKIQGSMNAVGNSTDSIKFSAVNEVAGWGGIHLINDWTVNMDDNDSTRIGYCSIQDISAGEAIQIEDFSKFRLFNCEIFNCTDGDPVVFLGGTKLVIAEDSSPMVENNVLHDNNFDCILYHWRNGEDVLNDPVFRNNIVRDNEHSTGIYSYNSSLQIVNNLVTSNGKGVAIYGYDNNPEAVPSIINCTISDNAEGGGYYEGGTGLICSNLGDALITNTIIYGNDVSDGSQIIINGKSPSFYNCLTETDILGFDGSGGGESFNGTYLYCLNLDPQFQDSTIYTLSQSSPCVNGGNPDTLGLNLASVDIYGSTRMYDSTADFLDRIDIGAVEYQGDPIPIKATMPEMLPIPGNYDNNQSLTLTAEPTGSEIWYSLNGSYPSSLYSTPITLSSDANVRAISYSSGIDSSFISYGEYKIYPSLVADTVSGVWSKVSSPYYVNGDIYVPVDSTLTIEPGVEVIFLGNYKFDIEGRVLAEGSIADSIHFHAEEGIQGWKGFDDHGMSFPDHNFASVYDYCIINDVTSSVLSTYYKNVIVKHSRISGNSAHVAYFYKSTNQILFCDIYDNNYDSGYAISYTAYGTDSLIIKYSKIHHNTCAGNGMCGVIYLGNQNSEISNCEIYNNLSLGAEAPISSYGTNLITNNAVYNNSAKYGGGIFISEAFGYTQTRIYNNTIVFNSAEKGGGIYIKNENDPILVNNIIYYNTSSEGGDQVYLFDILQVPNFTNCNIQGGKDAFLMGSEGEFKGLYKYCIDEDPEFLDSLSFDLRLQTYSPCVNYGTVNPDSLGLGMLDLSWNDRTVSEIDIGAYELLVDPNPERALLPQFSPFGGDHDPDVTVTITCPTSGVLIYYTFDGTDPDETSNLYSTPLFIDDFITLKAKAYGTGIEPSYITEADYDVFPNSISGNVSGLWQKINSPYYVNGNITILNDSTLTIEPGVEVIFTGHFSIFVEGQLLAQGAESDSISFKAFEEFGKWCNIFFDETAITNGASEIGYCILEDGSNDQITDAVIKQRNYSNVHIHHSTFRNNISESGGAIMLSQASAPIIEYCEFYNNESTMFGGSAIRCYDESDPIIRNNIFSNNIGTPIYLSDSSPLIVNNLISNNYDSGWGGGIYIYGLSNPVLTNNSIINNTAQWGAGGINLGGYSDYPSPSIRNTLIYGNTAPTGAQVSISGIQCQPEFNYCNIEGGKEAFGEDGPMLPDYKYLNNIDADPKFLNAGPYPYSHKSNSPCINAGSPDTTSMNIPAVDLAGRPRIYNGYVDIIDIGPYEYNGLATVEYSGTMSDSVRWVADIVEISGNVTATGMDSLKIVPGVHINFKDDYQVQISDSLIARGTNKDKIVIENAKGGFILNNSSKGEASVYIKHWIYSGEEDIIDDMISITGYDSIEIDSSTFHNVSIVIHSSGTKASSSGKKITNNRLSFSAATKGNNRIGIKIYGDDNIILQHNEIALADTGIVIYGSGAKASSGKKITNNRLSFSATTKGTTLGILLDNCMVDSLYHNSIYNAYEGIKVTNQTSTIEALNNIFWNESSLITQIIDLGSKLILKNNDISGTTDYNTGGNSGNINYDPLFVNPSIGDLHLSEGSPCIDSALVILDYPSVHAPDIGALEYGLSFSTPYNLTATGELGQIDLTWNSPYKSGKVLTQYYVYRNGTRIDSTSATNYSDTDIENNVEYLYHITAVYLSPDGESGISNYVTITGLTEFTIPSYLTGELDGDGISLSWKLISSSKGLNYYNIYKNGAFLNSTPNSAYIDTTTMSNFSVYQYYVTAVYEDPTAESLPSDTVSVTMYKPPVNLSYEVQNATVYVSWQTPESKTIDKTELRSSEISREPAVENTKDGLTGFQVYRNNQLIHSITDPEKLYYYDQGVTDGTHEYKIIAVYTSSISGYSDAVNAVVSSGVVYALNEGFEGATFPPDGWTLYDEDGDGANWIHIVENDLGDGTLLAHSGLNSAASVSDTIVVNWIISPGIDLTNVNTAELKFYTTFVSTPSEHYKVMLSTSTNALDDFNVTLLDFTPSKFFDIWHETKIDLSDYTGQTIYLAWVHEQTNMVAIVLDDITVTKFNATELATPENVSLSTAGGNVTITWNRIMKDIYMTYIVYSSTDLVTWTIEKSGIPDTSWSEPIGDAKKFYRVVASDAEPTKKIIQKARSSVQIR